jgi:hypothetical protein
MSMRRESRIILTGRDFTSLQRADYRLTICADIFSGNAFVSFCPPEGISNNAQ